MSRKLYVGNLPYETTEADLETLFASAGTVASVTVMRERETGRARGFAFVEMESDADAQNAINKLHDSSFGGRNLAVNEARPMAPRGDFGGGGAGGGGNRRRSEPRW
jgi:RNA recognition motif-containing protein